MHRLHSRLFRLLLTVALLGFAVAASAHDHEFSPPANDGICAICVYASSAPGAAGASSVAALPPQRHTRPESPRRHAPGSLARTTTRIRGPPAAG